MMVPRGFRPGGVGAGTERTWSYFAFRHTIRPFRTLSPFPGGRTPPSPSLPLPPTFRKPSELSPLTTVRLASLVEAAGFPPGAFNVLTGDGVPAGSELSKHPDVDKVSFTGSVKTGQVGAAASVGYSPCGA